MKEQRRCILRMPIVRLTVLTKAQYDCADGVVIYLYIRFLVLAHDCLLH